MAEQAEQQLKKQHSGKQHLALRVFNYIVLISFIGTAVFLVVRSVITIALAPGDAESFRSVGDYLPMFLECLLGIFAMMLPGILHRQAHIDIPSVMLLLYAAFLFCSIFLGEARSFYYTIPHFDTVLHIFSGAALASIGFSLVELLNASPKAKVQLSPLFVAIFAFCFAFALGAFWEICEFTVDNVFGTNAQKYALEDGTALIGQAALDDTMKDLIVDALGALAITAFGFILLRQNKTLPEWLKIQRESDSQVQNS